MQYETVQYVGNHSARSAITPIINALLALTMTKTTSDEYVRLYVDGIKRVGLKVGEHLVVLPYPYAHPENRKIYKLCNGKPLGNAVFDHDSAIDLAKKYTLTYAKYFDLWQEYPDLCLHSVTRWTIKHGHLYYRYFERKL